MIDRSRLPRTNCTPGHYLLVFGLAFSMISCKESSPPPATGPDQNTNLTSSVDNETVNWRRIPAIEWASRLSSEEFHVTREKGTELRFSGEYWNTKTPGIYHCICCDAPLFHSDTKFVSGTGWPSFWQPATSGVVEENEDRSLGGSRTEVSCQRCGAHLGHVFPDGPEPTGQRYCMNSVALKLRPLGPPAAEE